MLLALSVPFEFRSPSHASCRCTGGELDIVFVLDCTGSMQHVIGTMKAQIVKLLGVLGGRVGTLRVGVVVYLAHEATGQGLKTVQSQPLTLDHKQAVEFIRGCRAVGGGFEAVELGLSAAINDMPWTKGARKVMVLLGDEPCAEQREALCVQLAAQAKEKGIAVNTVTCSETAWRYYAMLHEKEWKETLAREGDAAKTRFRLPFFVDIANAGGGKAVSSNDTRELVMWLLAFGLGLKDGGEKDLNLNEYFAWTEPDAPVEARKPGPRVEGAPPRFMIAWIKHDGQWQAPHDFPSLLTHLKSKVELPGETGAHVARLTDSDLASYPILYMTGHGPAVLSDAEIAALVKHLRAGGMLVCDACCGDARFDESLRRIMDKAFGEGSLRRLPADHPVFRSGYSLRKVRFSALPRLGNFAETAPELFGVSVDGRLAAVYSARDLGCAWLTVPMGAPCQHHDEDGLALSVNILLYALTH